MAAINSKKRAGLFIIDLARQLTIINKRKYPYDKFMSAEGRNNKAKYSIFAEEYQIPRGCCQGPDEEKNTQLGALREHEEETKIRFKRKTILPKPFRLMWHDPELWEYDIYFGFADFDGENVIRIDNIYSKGPRRFSNRFEPLVPQVMPIYEYIRQIKMRLHLYGPNNYLEFIDHLKGICALREYI